VRVFRGKTWKKYPISIEDFLIAFNEVASDSPASNPLFFSQLVERLSEKLSMAKTDVIRTLAALLGRSRTFNSCVWYLPAFTNAGTKLMLKVAGWAPTRPFDVLAIGKGITEEDIAKIKQELKEY